MITPRKKVVLAVFGSRWYENKNAVWFQINEIRKVYNVVRIVTGDARGPDRWTREYADYHKIALSVHSADWSDLSEPCVLRTHPGGEKYNALAGLKRNTFIANEGDIGLMFWDGKSTGTADTLKKMTDQKKKVFKINI